VELLDQVRSQASAAQITTAPLVAAGLKDRSGKHVTLVSPDDEVRRFLERLSQPSDHDRVRQAILREVAG
jgi:hypothetical protein